MCGPNHGSEFTSEGTSIAQVKDGFYQRGPLVYRYDGGEITYGRPEDKTFYPSNDYVDDRISDFARDIASGRLIPFTGTLKAFPSYEGKFFTNLFNNRTYRVHQGRVELTIDGGKTWSKSAFTVSDIGNPTTFSPRGPIEPNLDGQYVTKNGNLTYTVKGNSITFIENRSYSKSVQTSNDYRDVYQFAEAIKDGRLTKVVPPTNDATPGSLERAEKATGYRLGDIVTIRSARIKGKLTGFGRINIPGEYDGERVALVILDSDEDNLDVRAISFDDLDLFASASSIEALQTA